MTLEVRMIFSTTMARHSVCLPNDGAASNKIGSSWTIRILSLGVNFQTSCKQIAWDCCEPDPGHSEESTSGRLVEPSLDH